MEPFVFVPAAAILVWVAVKFVGKPLFAFGSLRNEAARLLTLYESAPDSSPSVWVGARKAAVKGSAARLARFAQSRRCATGVLRLVGYHPRRAAAVMVLLADAKNPIDVEELRASAAKALKLRLPKTLKLRVRG